MMRITGAVLIFAACFYAGFIKTRALSMRESNLSMLMNCLLHIRNAIACRNDALPELFSRLSNQFDGQAGQFFKVLYSSTNRIGETSFANIWTDAIKSIFTELYDIEYSELSKLGQIIGRCDSESQIRAIMTSEVFFNSVLEELRRELPQKRKLALGLSATAGAFTVILLI